MGTLVLKSAVFKEGGTIPEKYTCDGENINPLIEIVGTPENTKSMVLIVDDPDAPAGTWDHWIMWNIDPKTSYIHEDSIPAGAVQGNTSFGKPRYGGPCPPKGDKPHRYVFKLYTLDAMLDLPETATRQELEQAMKGHILAQTTLTGKYKR